MGSNLWIVERLIRTQSPFPNVEDGAQTGDTRSERFYYDGIRRVQEVITDPVVTTEKMLTSGEPELEALALEDLETTGEEEVDLKAASVTHRRRFRCRCC